MEPVKFLDKLFYTASARDYAKLTNMAAQRSKNIAMELYYNGINNNVTKYDIMNFAADDAPGTYDKLGNLTKKGTIQILDMLKEVFNLSEEAAKKMTLGQALKEIVKRHK